MEEGCRERRAFASKVGLGLCYFNRLIQYSTCVSFRFRQNETSVNFEDRELLINDKLKHSHRGIDDLISHGSAVLDSLRLQGGNLRSIKQKLFDIGQTVSYPVLKALWHVLHQPNLRYSLISFSSVFPTQPCALSKEESVKTGSCLWSDALWSSYLCTVFTGSGLADYPNESVAILDSNEYGIKFNYSLSQ